MRLLVLCLAPSLVLLAGCPAKITGADDGRETADDTGEPDSDPGDDTGSPEGDTVGPDLPACTPQAGDGDQIALSGVVLAPEGPVAGVVVYRRSTGLISCVGADCDTAGAEVVCTEGVISAGLIDSHNHMQYNSLPPWEVGAEFDDRYDWQDDDRYDDFKEAFNAIKDDYTCEIMKWAELREMIHGTTAAVGSSGGDCIHVLIRNLDEDSESSGITGYDLTYSSSDVTESLDESDGESYTSSLASGADDAVLQHVAEGRGGSVSDEIDWMTKIGMTGPGQAYVHAADATTTQLAQMATDGTGIIWSPRSNLALYGTTTPITIADKLGVPWAIGTDWTPSGSMAPTRELACAAEWLAAKGDPVGDVRLHEKVTVDAARMVGLDGVLGVLSAGYRADIAVFDWSSTPYRGIINAGPGATRLVVIEGEATYGLDAWKATLAENPEWCETLAVCDGDRFVCVQAADSGDDAQTLAEVESTLESALLAEAGNMAAGYEYAAALYPLFECEDSRPSCDLSVPGAGDDDGDGIDDATDVCPGIYDPEQWDTDGDGEGDDCDVCPLVADATECETAAGDTDGDGVPNESDNCIYVGNADQADADADGVGDVCDACPDEPNPDGAGCTLTIADVRDPSSANHPAEGTVVTIEGVVTVLAGTGFFLQEPTGGYYSGIFIYDFGANVVETGDLVTVTGTYDEYYEFTELTDPIVTITGSGTAPTALLQPTCDLATGSATAELFESMLVRVEGATITNANPDDPDDYDEVELEDCLRMDDYVYLDLDQGELGTTYATISGVLIYTYDNFKIAPRDASDLELYE